MIEKISMMSAQISLGMKRSLHSRAKTLTYWRKSAVGHQTGQGAGAQAYEMMLREGNSVKLGQEEAQRRPDCRNYLSSGYRSDRFSCTFSYMCPMIGNGLKM